MSHKFNCTICNSTFEYQYLLTRHLESAKHKFRIDNNNVTFDCVCGKKFSHNKSLIFHTKSCEIYKDSTTTSTPSLNHEDELRNEISTLKENISHVKELFESLKKELFESLKKELLKENSHLQSTKKSTRVKISDSIRQRIAQDQSRQCKQCNTLLTSVFQIDHKTALRFGGTNDPSNLQALCTECHVNKSRVESKYQQKINEFIESTIRDGLQELSNLQQK
jgi:hypothetical protein